MMTSALSSCFVLPHISRTITNVAIKTLANNPRVCSRLFLEPDFNNNVKLSDSTVSDSKVLSFNGSDGINETSSIAFVVLAALAIAISYADRSNLSTAIIPMAKQFNWDSLFSGFVLSAFWAGYATTQVLGGALADGFGGELLLVFAMLLWSGATAATPVAAAAGTVQVLAARVLLGAGEGLALPAIHSMIRKYVLPAQRSIAASVVTAACFLGALVSNLIAPVIIDKFDWETCFYGFAAIPTLIWIPLWSLFLFNDGKRRNAKSTGSTQPDTPRILFEKSDLADESPTIIQLLKEKPVWGIIAAQYGQSWGLIGLLSWLPTYYSQRFGVPISSLASYTVLPYFLQLLTSVAAGTIADVLIGKGVRVLTVRKGLQTVGMLAPALCLSYCSYATGLSAQQAAGLITAGSAISALTVGAVSCNHFDISPKNAGAVFGIGNTASCIGGLIAVPFSGFIYDTTHSWSLVFALFSAHYLIGCVLYNLWASDVPLTFQKKTVKSQ